MSSILKYISLMALASSCSAEAFQAYLASAGDASEAGIIHLSFDSQNGEISTPEKVTGAPQPYYMETDSQGSYLYATYDDGQAGQIISYSINYTDSSLSKRGQAPTGGILPLHLSLHPNQQQLIVANYLSPTVSSISILPGGKLSSNNDIQTLTGSSLHPKRQDHSYPHSITFHPNGDFAYACDRGSDRIYSYRFDAANGGLAPAEVPFVSTRPGSGPRHMAFHPDGLRAYVINEINSSVTAYRVDPESGALTEGPSYPAIPQSFHGENYSAEIALHPNGNYLYASNRGHDSVSVFRIGSDTELSPLQNLPSGGQHPRYFAIDPTGHWLLVSNRQTNNVSVFSLDPSSGLLNPTSNQLSISQPLRLVFIR